MNEILIQNISLAKIVFFLSASFYYRDGNRTEPEPNEPN